MKKTRLGLGCLVSMATLLLFATSGQATDGNQTDAERIDALFALYDNPRSPGCSLAVVREGRTVFARGYGMADLERSVPLSTDSVFRIASTSKQFTAAAIVLLSQEGQLSLDDDVRRTVPELQERDPKVTLRQLIQHTSGVRDYLTLMWLAGKRDEDYSDDEVLAILGRQTQLNFAPGDEHLYSNSGYWLLSQVVLRATGESLREYAARAIFQPLGMADTHFHDDPAEIVARRALGYAPLAGGGFEISMTRLPMIGDGGVFTTVSDLALWDKNFYEPQVGGLDFLDVMHERAVLNDGEVLPYASGLSHGTYRGLPTVSHGGAFVGFRAQMLRFPEQRTTFICLCNRADANPTRLARKVADIVLEQALDPAEEESATSTKTDDEESALRLSATDRAAITGDFYCGELASTYHLTESENLLELSIGEHPPKPVEARTADLLRLENGSVSLALERGSDGTVTGFVLEAGRVKNIHFERIAVARKEH